MSPEIVHSDDILASLPATFEFLQGVGSQSGNGITDWEAVKKQYLAHLSWRFESAQTAHKSQIALTWVITVIVIALVGLGVAFSLLQLHALVSSPVAISPTTEVSVGSGGLTVTSPIAGIAILALSFAFFLLFLKYVFLKMAQPPVHLALTETDFFKFQVYRHAEKRLRKSGRTLNELLDEMLKDEPDAQPPRP